MVNVNSSSRKKSSNAKVAVSEQDIHAQFEQLKADFAELAKTVKEEAISKASDAKLNVTAKASDTTEAASEKYDELTKEASRQIRSNPFTSVAIAVGAGFLFGALSRK